MKTWPLIRDAIEAKDGCALVSVVETEGSTPRETGARMIVTPDGLIGTIGGGTLEWRAIAAAQELMAKSGGLELVTYALGPGLGQCCGGRVRLAIEAFGRGDLPRIGDLAKREERGPFEMAGRIAGAALVEKFGSEHRRVCIFGAGHVGRALMLALAPLPFDVQWIDPRPGAFPGAVPGNVTCSAEPDPASVVARAPAGALVFVMTHSHALDLAVVEAALRSVSIAATGLIGSASKRARFERRLAAAGIAPSRIAALICPIGVEGVRSKEPAAIAASTAVQILLLDERLRAAMVSVSEPGGKRAGRGQS
jgi:xanthine dehydrogenase accessory factor